MCEDFHDLRVYDRKSSNGHGLCHLWAHTIEFEEDFFEFLMQMQK